jgi:hypothetical protein
MCPDEENDNTPPPSASPTSTAVSRSIVIAVAGLAAAYWLWTSGDEKTLTVGSEYSAFAGLFVLTAALERMLAPLTWKTSGVAKQESQAAVAAREKQEAQASHASAVAGLNALRMPGIPDAMLQNQTAVVTNVQNELKRLAGKAADEATRLAQKRANALVYLWAISTVVAAVLCAYAGVMLLHLISGTSPSTATATASAVPAVSFTPAAWLDLILTALVVGAGTSQLSSLITNVKKPAPATGGTSD